MRLIFGLVFLVGLGLAGFAVMMAKNYINAHQAQLDAERAKQTVAIETVDIYVANRVLKYGEKLLKEDVKLVPYPVASLPEGVFKTEEEMFPEGEDEPRSVMRNIEPLEAIMAVKVTKAGEPAGIASQLKKGMRAFAIKVDVASGVSGFLRPGDFVDVYWTGNLGGRNLLTENNSQGDVTKLIQSGIKIIAVDQDANTDTSQTSIARTVTVTVRPEEVAALALAQSTGRLSLSLLGAADDTVAQFVELDQNRLLGIQQQAAAPAPKLEEQKVCTIRTRKGSEVILTPIPCSE